MATRNRLDLGVPCLWAGFSRGSARFLAVDGRLHVQTGQRAEVLSLHQGDVLAVCDAGLEAGLLSAGEDGRIVLTAPSGKATCVACLPAKAWVQALAVAGDGAMAYGCGRTAWLIDGAGAAHVLAQERPVLALGFSQDGRWLAIATYDRLILHDRRDATCSRTLTCKGLPTAVAFSPDDAFVMLCTREAMLHGWRLRTGRHFRMVGYARPVLSLSWLHGAAWLATDGANGAVLWPFEKAEGPIGSLPVMLGHRPQGRASAVACHPGEPSVAVGYEDGLIALESMDGVVRRVLGQADGQRVDCLGWDETGTRLAFGAHAGACGVIQVGGG